MKLWVQLDYTSPLCTVALQRREKLESLSANSFSLSPQCQFIFTQPTGPIHFHSAHSAISFSLSPQCEFIFTQPTVRIHFHSAHSTNSFSLSPQCQFIFTQPTVPIHFHSARSANPFELSPQCQFILTKPTGPIHFTQPKVTNWPLLYTAKWFSYFATKIVQTDAIACTLQKSYTISSPDSG